MNKPLIPLSKPSIGQAEQQAVAQVLASNALSRGPYLTLFEDQFKSIYGSQYAIGISSGTAGLILALKALQVGVDDEVITVSFTVPATVNAIIAVGAKPKLIDIDPNNLGMCPKQLEKAITSNTKAVIVVHAFGQSAHIHGLKKVCTQHSLPLIEDACETIGNRYNNQLLGTFGDLGIFGFYPNKQITCGEGGMVITNNKQHFELIKSMRNHGRVMNGDLYDQQSFGWNFRLPEISAALGYTQLNRLDEIKGKRQHVAALYQRNLADINGITTPQFQPAESDAAWFVYVLKLAHVRENIFADLFKQNIQCGRYFAPIHLQPYWAKHHQKLNLKVTEKIASETLAVPFYTDMSDKEVNRVCETIIESFHKYY